MEKYQSNKLKNQAFLNVISHSDSAVILNDYEIFIEKVYHTIKAL